MEFVFSYALPLTFRRRCLFTYGFEQYKCGSDQTHYVIQTFYAPAFALDEGIYSAKFRSFSHTKIIVRSVK